MRTHAGRCAAHPAACNRVLDAASQVGDQVERELFPSFLLSDLFFRFMSDPAAVAEVEAELAAEAGPFPNTSAPLK